MILIFKQKKYIVIDRFNLSPSLPSYQDQSGKWKILMYLNNFQNFLLFKIYLLGQFNEEIMIFIFLLGFTHKKYVFLTKSVQNNYQ
jgi:hypothetical protein